MNIKKITTDYYQLTIPLDQLTVNEDVATMDLDAKDLDSLYFGVKEIRLFESECEEV